MLCTQCGIQLPDNYEHGEICGHHASIESDNWAAANKIVCDGLHRGIWAARLSQQERDADFFVTGGMA